MNNLYRSLLLIFLVPFFLKAQSNYKPGHIVTLKGDTIKGYVDYKEWDKNPIRINFKTSLNNKDPEKISPQNAKAFAITGFELYEAYTIPVSQDQVEVSRLSAGIDTSKTVSAIFLQQVVKGKNIDLFYYKDDIKPRYFTRERITGTPTELIYRTYLNANDVNQIITQPKYRSQLQEMAKRNGHADESLMRKIELSDYNQTDLTGIINSINGEMAGQTKQASFRRHNTRFFAGTGINKADINYMGVIVVADNSTSRSAYSPKLTFGLDAFLNPNIGRLILRAEMSFIMANFKTTTNPSAPFYGSKTVDQITISFTPQLIYNVFNTDALKIYLGAGASINYSSYSNNNYNYAQERYSGKTVLLADYPKMASDWISFYTRAGVVLNNKLEFYLGYMPSATITDHYTTLFGSVTYAQAGVNYLFGNKH